MQANWSYQSRQFFETSTLHGVRYIAEKGRPFHERLVWFISTTGGLMAALVIVDSLWDKFQSSPTITGLDSDYHSWDVPFPALTLCPQQPANDTLVDEYISEKWGGADEEKQEYYRRFLLDLTNISYANLPKLLPYINNDKLPQKNLRQLALKFYKDCQLFTTCAYRKNIDDPTDCCTLLYPVFTEHGFCFAFNLNYTIPDWPGRFKKPSFKEDLIEETDTKWSFVFDTEDPINNSIAVFLSPADDLPGAEVNSQHLWTRRVSKLMFVPKMTYTVESAKQLSIKQRGCVFPREIKLGVSWKYTFSSCLRQCRMEKLFKACNCVPFFYDQLPGQRYCELREHQCIIDNLPSPSEDCSCQLGCDHTVYDMEKPHEAGGDAGGEMETAPGLEVGFLSWPLTRFKRDVLFGQVDLLVAIGTIAGLFLGFSLLSGVEIVYLFTLRAWCMIHTDRELLEELALEYEREEKSPLDLSLRPSFLKNSAAPDQGQGIVSVSPVETEAGGPPMWRRNPVLVKNHQNAMMSNNGLFQFVP